MAKVGKVTFFFSPYLECRAYEIFTLTMHNVYLTNLGVIIFIQIHYKVGKLNWYLVGKSEWLSIQ